MCWIGYALLAAGTVAASAAELSVGRGSASPGSAANLEVRFSAQGSRITGVQFDLTYDPGLTPNPSLGPAAANSGKSLNSNDLGPGTKRLLIAGLNQTVIPDGVIVTLAVAVRATMAPGEYPVRLKDARGTDANGRTVAITTTDGQVTVLVPGGAPQPRVTAGNATVSAGSSVTVELTLASGQAQITGLQLDLVHDPNLSLTPAIGPVASAAGKTLSTAALLGAIGQRIMLAGLNQTALGDGVIITLAVAVARSTPPGLYALRLSNARGTDKDGRLIVLATTDGSVTVGAPVGSGNQGAFAYIASGAHWKTSFVLFNPTTSQLSVVLRFWAQDGQELSLPLACPQPGEPFTTVASSLERNLEPLSMQLVETEWPEGIQPAIGWAELLAPRGATGFAILRFRDTAGRESEAVAPLEARGQSAWVLPYENTSGFVTTLAVANLSESDPVTVELVLRDAAGQQLSVETLWLPPRGQETFPLTDRIPAAAERRGLLELEASGGARIAAVGLRSSETGAFTAIPAAAK